MTDDGITIILSLLSSITAYRFMKYCTPVENDKSSESLYIFTCSLLFIFSINMILDYWNRDDMFAYDFYFRVCIISSCASFFAMVGMINSKKCDLFQINKEVQSNPALFKHPVLCLLDAVDTGIFIPRFIFYALFILGTPYIILTIIIQAYSHFFSKCNNYKKIYDLYAKEIEVIHNIYSGYAVMPKITGSEKDFIKEHLNLNEEQIKKFDQLRYDPWSIISTPRQENNKTDS
ncbi:MAG: hypothetical protein Q7S87_04625 [Agitococcus sp.]|nr:hypothetical protein [Agitococcus sp.]